MGRARRRKQQRSEDRGGRTEVVRTAPPGTRWNGVLPFLAPMAIVALGVAIYANSFSIPFLFDDYFAIVSNPDLTRLAPLSEYLSQSRGIPALITALNYRWGELQVWGYHLVNVALHIVNALLVWLVVSRTLRLRALADRYGARAQMLAIIVALVFLAHPLQTNVASYIVQRSEAIGALFFLSALLFYLRAERCTGHEPRWGWFAACFVAACFGIVSKETTASLPLVLLLFHFTVRPGGDPGTQPGWRRWGLFVALLLPVLYGLYLSRHVLSSAYSFGAGIEPEEQRAWLYIPTAGFQLEGITPWSYLITQFGVIVWYLRLFLFPSRQCFDYGWPIRDSFWSTDVLAPLAILAGLTLAAILARRRYPVATLGFGWFLLTLSPSSSVIPIRDAAFEYRMYLPLIGLALVAVAAGSDAIDWLVRRGRLAAESVWQIGAAVAATWIFALAGASIWRNHILQDETRLALDSVAVAPLHWRNQFALGDVLNKQGREDEAIAAFEKAVELGPEQGTPRVVLGALYGKRGRLEEAESVLLLATDVAEESVAAAAYRQLGFLYKAMNHPGSAVMMFRESLQRKPSWAPLRLELWRLFLYEGDWRSAAIEINEAAESQPAYKTSMAGDLARTNYLAAVVAFENGEKTLATWFALAAVRYQSEFPEAQHYLAYIRSREGDWEAARRLMDSVVSQRPDDGLAAANWDRTRREEILVAPASRQSLGG